MQVLFKTSEETEKRIEQLEYALNLNDNKPAIFEQIFNELVDKDINLKKTENGILLKVESLE